jgi:hypothetical protein
MKAPSFRLYKYVDERFQLMGLKMEQIGIIMFGLMSFLIVQDVLSKIVCLLGASFSFFVSRKLSKKLSKISFKSFVNWHFGFSSDFGSKFPKSSARRVVGE